MSKLVITRGLPASGKTKFAREWVKEDPIHRVRVNLDDYRDMMFGGWTGETAHEIAVVKASEAAVSALLDKGYDVIMDNTFLRQRHARDARMLALRHGSEFEVVDMTDVDVETCITRDAHRIAQGDRGVGEDVIRTMHWKLIRGRSYPLPFPEEPSQENSEVNIYVPPLDKPKAVVVDVDGTVALMVGRSPYDETRVHEDRPNHTVIRIVQSLYKDGYEILFVSGRHDVCKEATFEWLSRYVIPTEDFELLMRKDGDNRKDFIVKREIFDAEIRHNYNVVACLDDRKQVVDMYRSLGLTVMQVAEGNF